MLSACPETYANAKADTSFDMCSTVLNKEHVNKCAVTRRKASHIGRASIRPGMCDVYLNAHVDSFKTHNRLR